MKAIDGKIQPCLLALMVAGLSGCLATTEVNREHTPPGTPGGEREQAQTQEHYTGTTLGDLESTEVTVEAQELQDASPAKALESYRRAVELFHDDDRRSESLRRMADLALTAAEEGELEHDEEMLEEAPATAMDQELEQELDREIDRTLYENFMRQAEETEDREERLALLDLAGGIVPGLDESDLETDYNTAILLYESVLETTRDPADRAEAKYLLAKAHDLAGNFDQMRETLDALAEKHPQSQFYVEAQFRRGEIYFNLQEYDTASHAYAAVVNTIGAGEQFYNQALYKRGWSDYLLADYEGALDSFFTLVDTLYDSPEIEEEDSMLAKLVDDTQRAISLSFSQLDGPESVREWFAEREPRPYESGVYGSLGELYLNQQRFRDAADTFRTFADVNPGHALAPQFASQQVRAYERGGFPDLVLPAKKAFIEDFGIHSDYWEQNPETRENYAELLKEHILDLAGHHHARAQNADEPQAYEEPARWYAEYLETPPQTDREAEINHRYAEVLFSAQNFAEAIEEFERTAYEYPDYPEADRAGYFAMVAYQNQLRVLPDETEKDLERINEWLDRKIASGLRFATEHPDNERVPTVLRNVVQDQIEREDLESAVSTAGRLVSLDPPPPDDLLRFGWATIADGEFEMSNYGVAEFAYERLLNVPGHDQEQRQEYIDRLGASVYRQAEAREAEAEDAEDEEQRRELLAEAAETFLRVTQAAPASEVRKPAEYDAAALYMELEDYASAVPILEVFRERYPDDELAENVPDQLAIAYEETGQYTDAARELERIADRDADEDPQLARAALWEAAEMQDRTNRPDESVRLYRRYANEWPQPWERNSEAKYRLANLYDEAGDEQSRRFWLEELIDNVHQAGPEATDRVAYLGAWAAYEFAEPEFEEFGQIRLTQPLRDSLSRKTRAMEEAMDAYELVLDLGVREYVTAAQFRMGEMYAQLAEDILDSERPTGLSDLELDQYELLLEDQALPYEDRAIDMFIENADLVGDDIYDEHVRRSFQRLSELVPGRYAKHEQVEDYVDIIY